MISRPVRASRPASNSSMSGRATKLDASKEQKQFEVAPESCNTRARGLSFCIALWKRVSILPDVSSPRKRSFVHPLQIPVVTKPTDNEAMVGLDDGDDDGVEELFNIVLFVVLCS